MVNIDVKQGSSEYTLIRGLGFPQSVDQGEGPGGGTAGLGDTLGNVLGALRSSRHEDAGDGCLYGAHGGMALSQEAVSVFLDPQSFGKGVELTVWFDSRGKDDEVEFPYPLWRTFHHLFEIEGKIP